MMWGSGIQFAPIAAWVCGLVMGVAVLQILLHPLRVTRKRTDILLDLLIVVLCFIGLFPGISEVVGVFALLGVLAAIMGLAVFASPLVLIVCVVLYFLTRKKSSTTDVPMDPAAQFSLSEALAMVLAGTSLPLVMSAMGLGEPARNLLYMLALIPPLYLRAWKRLRANYVRHSPLRVAFLTLYPYLIFSVLYLCMFLATSMVPEANSRMDKSAVQFFNGPAAILFFAVTLLATFITWNLERDILPDSLPAVR